MSGTHTLTKLVSGVVDDSLNLVDSMLDRSVSFMGELDLSSVVSSLADIAGSLRPSAASSAAE